MVDGRFPEGSAEALRRKLIEDAKQADLQQQFEQKKAAEAELQQRLLQDHGPALEKMAAARLVDNNPELEKSAAEFLAGELARKRVLDPVLMDGIDLSRAADRAVGEAIKAEDLKREQETQEQARKAEELKHKEADKQARELKEANAKKIAMQEAVRAEPIPGNMQQFNAILAASKANKEGQTVSIAPNLPNFSRPNDLKTTVEPSRMTDNPLMTKGLEKGNTRSEVTDARANKAEKLQRMFESNTSRDKDFDATHDPSNSMNYSNGRGGRGR